MPADPTDRALSLAPPVFPSPRSNDKPAAAAKLLGAYLRRLRRERGMKIAEVAPAVRASISKISRMERGESAPRPRDVFDLLALYEVHDPQLRKEVEELLRQVSASAWWHQFSDVTPGWLKRLIGLEDSAIEVRTYEVHVVPGLLQTPPYTRAILKAGLPTASEAEIQRRLELRHQRQQILNGEGRPLVRAFLDESILYRPVGGPEVMRGQLEHLLHMDEVDKVHVRVVRFDKGACSSPPSPVTLLRFPPGGLAEMVYLEQANNALYLSKDSDVQSYRLALDKLSDVAESRNDSKGLLREAINRFTAMPTS